MSSPDKRIRYNEAELDAMFERSKIDHISAAFVGSEVRVLIGMARESLETQSSATSESEGYPGIAHGYEVMRSALQKIVADWPRATNEGAQKWARDALLAEASSHEGTINAEAQDTAYGKKPSPGNRSGIPAASAPSATMPPADPELDALVKDAARYRWLRQHLQVQADAPGEWTCWLGLAQIPYRSKTDDGETLLDELMARFPLAPADGGCQTK